MLFLRTLGGISLTRDDEPLGGAATQRRRLALLALLATAGERGISRDKLVAMLWPESEEEKARHTLSQWLFLLRKDLREPELVVGATELRLNGSLIGCDAADFERALARGDRERALALYGGPFLDGFFLSDAAEFGRWTDDERARLERAAFRAAEALAREATAGGDVASAVRWWEWLATRDRLSSSAALGYMRALSSAGERARAIQHGRIHEALVRQELEGEPDGQVTALVRLLQSEPAPAATGPATVTREVAAPTTEVRKQPRRSAPVRLTDLSAVSRAASRASEIEPGRVNERADRGLTRSRLARLASARWRRHGRNIIAGALGAAILLGLAGAPRGSPQRAAAPLVLVADFDNRSRDSTLDPLGGLAAHWIARGLGDAGLVEVTTMGPREERVERLSEAELRRRALDAGATAIVRGDYYAYGDSLVVEARIIEAASGRVLRTVGPTTTSRAQPIAGLEWVRQHAMGALAIAVDPVYGPSATSMTTPPTYEAFRELAAGDEDAVARRWTAAIDHYRRAATLDVGYLTPLVRATNVFRDAWRCVEVDSVRRLIERSGGQLARLDEAALQANVAICRGDIARNYQIQRRIVELVPASDRAKAILANVALRLNRPREVVAIMDGLDLDRPSLRAAPNIYLDYTLALHLIGDHARELEVARRARVQHPTSAIPFMCEARALAVLGRVDDLRRVLAESQLIRPWQGWNEPDVFVTAADELEAHGRLDAATRIREELVGWLRTHRTENQEQERARFDNLTVTLGLLGRHAEALASMDSLDHLGADVFERTTLRGRLAALRGDTASAAQFADSLARLQVPFPMGIPTYGRAQLAALTGQRERAVELLRQSIAEGIPYTNTREGRSRGFNHVVPEFRALRGFQPFEELLRPRD